MSSNALKTQQELLEILEDVCEQLGWIICIPKEAEDESPTNGLIVGDEEFISAVLSHLPLENPEILDETFNEIENPHTKKNESMH